MNVGRFSDNMIATLNTLISYVRGRKGKKEIDISGYDSVLDSTYPVRDS